MSRNNERNQGRRGDRNQRANRNRRKKRNDKLKIIALGGLNEIGKNCYVLEYGNDIIIMDLGLTFPNEDMLGIDVVIPDITYLKENANKVRGLFLSHGHEDHYGAVPYALKEMPMDVYGTRLTLGLLKNKFKEHRLSNKHLKEIKAGEKIKVGVFEVEFVNVSHSIPDACAINVKTPEGNVFFTGDFKIDHTPIDGVKTDLPRISELGDEGVLVLMSDSTNVEREGTTLSEKTVGETFKDVFSRAPSRMVVATFASNLHRVQQVINASEHFGRRVAISGRSMINNVEIALELGYLKAHRGTIINLNDIGDHPPDKITILTTGSQGEPMSALTRMAKGEHRQVKLDKTDTVLISASPIPGNEKTVGAVLNNLTEMGVNVIYSALADVHVSGHACQEELKLIHALARPQYFMPVHGESRHLRFHAKLAEEMGMAPENVIVCANGDVVEFDGQGAAVAGQVQAGKVLVDGYGVGDVGNIVLRDRKHLSEDGLLVVVVAYDKNERKLLDEVDIVSRGFVYVKESEDLMNQCKALVEKAINDCRSKQVHGWSAIKSAIRDDLRKFLAREINRNPMILPVIIEV